MNFFKTKLNGQKLGFNQSFKGLVHELQCRLNLTFFLNPAKNLAQIHFVVFGKTQSNSEKMTSHSRRQKS